MHCVHRGIGDSTYGTVSKWTPEGLGRGEVNEHEREVFALVDHPVASEERRILLHKRNTICRRVHTPSLLHRKSEDVARLGVVCFVVPRHRFTVAVEEVFFRMFARAECDAIVRERSRMCRKGDLFRILLPEVQGGDRESQSKSEQGGDREDGGECEGSDGHDPSPFEAWGNLGNRNERVYQRG